MRDRVEVFRGVVSRFWAASFLMLLMSPNLFPATVRGQSSEAFSKVMARIDARVLAPAEGRASDALIRAYYGSILRWGDLVLAAVRPVPGREGECYLGLPRNVEDDVRPTAYAAMTLAFLAGFTAPGVEKSDDWRAARREAAKNLLRYLTASHVTGGGACVNGRPLGEPVAVPPCGPGRRGWRPG